MAELKDSGSRRGFGTGAVRDMAEGKGRCDLLPLREVAELMDNDPVLHLHAREQRVPRGRNVPKRVQLGDDRRFPSQYDPDESADHRNGEKTA